MPKVAKPAAHPLEGLFRSKLRDTSWAKFQVAEQALKDLPQPWRWPDPKTGVEWTLMGRKAGLMWHASNAHFIRNHTTTCHTIEQAIKHNEAWHESIPGEPDILRMWLASMRDGSPHTRTQGLIGRATKGHKAGLGKPGDGGYLDQMIGMVEKESQAIVDPIRRMVLHEATSKKWLHGVILRCINPGSGDWRPICNESLPLVWPVETLERVFSLARRNTQADRSVFYMAGTATAWVEQLSVNDVSERMQQLMEEDFLIDPAQHATGTMAGLEHYQSRGANIASSVIEKLEEFIDAPWMSEFPHLQAQAMGRKLQQKSPTAPARPASRSRL